MRRRSVILAAAFILGSCVPTKADVLPAAVWLTPWRFNYQYDLFSTPFGANLDYCFGVGCTPNGGSPPPFPAAGVGDLGAAGEPLPGTLGHFEEDLATRVGLLFPTIANETTVFARRLDLSGSPTGWTLTLAGNYIAHGRVDNSSFNPLVVLGFHASVYTGAFALNDIFATDGNLNGNLLPLLGYTGPGSSPGLRTPPDPNVFGPTTAAFVPVSNNAALANGTYWVVGNEFISGQIEGSAAPGFRSGAADGLFDAEINLSATPAPAPPPPVAPVPEPASVLLFGSVVLVLGLRFKRIFFPTSHHTL